MRSLKALRKSLVLDWGHFIVLNSIMGFCLWYFFDAYNTSKSISNMIFIAPATLVVCLLYLLILPSLFLKKGSSTSWSKTDMFEKVIIPGFLVVAFAIFISSIERIGIDIAAYIFLSVGLIICGERNRLTLLILPPITVVILVLSFKSMIPYPLPTTLL